MLGLWIAERLFARDERKGLFGGRGGRGLRLRGSRSWPPRPYVSGLIGSSVANASSSDLPRLASRAVDGCRVRQRRKRDHGGQDRARDHHGLHAERRRETRGDRERHELAGAAVDLRGAHDAAHVLLGSVDLHERAQQRLGRADTAPHTSAPTAITRRLGRAHVERRAHAHIATPTASPRALVALLGQTREHHAPTAIPGAEERVHPADHLDPVPTTSR